LVAALGLCMAVSELALQPFFDLFLLFIYGLVLGLKKNGPRSLDSKSIGKFSLFLP